MTRTSPQLVALPVRAFTDALAARTATPGGGSMAGVLVAAGSALVSMAFRFSTGDKFAAVAPYMQGRAEELDALREKALELVDKDSEAYDQVTAAYKLPKLTDADKAARAEAVQKGLKAALSVPMETLETAVAALRIAAAGAADANRNLASDLASGALCLCSAAEAAYMNVTINANGLSDQEFALRESSAAEALRSTAAGLLAQVRGAAEKALSK